MSDSPPPPPPPPPPPASPREAAPPSPQPPPPNLSGPPRLGRSNSLPAPSSKLLAHQPLDAPDDLDRNWAWHFMMAQKHVPGEKDIEKWQAAEGFEKHTAMLYGLLTDNREEYWILLQKLWEGNESLRDKSFQGLVALIDVRFLRLIPPSRVNLLWFIEQCIQACFVVDTLLIVLMRHIGSTIQIEPCLIQWLVTLFTKHPCSDSLAPHLLYTLLSILPELHQAKPSDSLAIQVTECAAALYAAKSAQVVSSGRELRRLAYDLREVPALAAMSKGLLDNPSLPLTPSKFLVCRLTFKMQEQLRFVMDKVLHVAAHRYQKWFQASFLHVQPYEGLIADIVRYVCAVHQPTSQAVEAKMTPRYHILGWLLLLNKSPAAKTRVLHAMFFDFLNYQAEVPIMHLEPAMMLLLKSTKNRNHPMVQDIVQFLVTHMDSSAKETAVSNAISALIKLGMMKNLQPLHDYLKEFNPALWTKCQQALPQHFNFSSAPASVTSSPSHSPVHTSSPLRQTPPPQAPPAGRGNSPQSSPQHASPKYSPKDSQPRLPSSSPTEDQTNWTEQSFLEDQKLPIDTNPATVVIPETLASFRDQIASLQQSQSEVDKLIPALSVIFTAWSHLPNAIAISGELGGLLYKCLEKSFLTTTTLPHYVLDQCLQRPPQLYLPLLHGMYKQDSVLSARLLTYCCVHENLQPYLLFCEVLGVGDIPQAVLQDVSLCAHLDEACALACSLLQVPYAGNAVESTCLRTVPYLFQHAPPAYLPRTDSLVRALVGVATPNILSTLSMRLVLKEFAIFCDQTTTVLLSSLQWNSWEQTSVWELLAAEWEAKRKDKATVAALRKVLACLDPHVHGEALSGILRLLLQCTPDVSLLHCILKLSDTFDPFPSSVLSMWIEKCFSTMQSFVVVMLQEPKDASDVCRQLNKLPENALVTDPDIRKAIQGYLNDQGTSGADLFPALSALVLTDDAQPPQPPPAKKPRVE
ncbi:unnamed protein product [Aphanomyces euteiches]|uniref:Integrator complex subunit 3 n=1 Tax=Aphanomyces euteiches TaxID=100861 RepID=A0A6G0X5N9_9STRA|nr:hypothetical protein Ae201684_008218 [Aphanomyces euteiches]KAH9070613.1 hypothetical protein Ae201684P_002970 [Aphanomyces euteiches]KAH9138444.1 hypothetical protein AeRB84_017228 [Aphanomyces euteiches]